MASSSSPPPLKKSHLSEPPAYYPQEWELVTIPLSDARSTDPQPSALQRHPLPYPNLDLYRRRALKGYCICVLISIIIGIGALVTGLKIHELVKEHALDAAARNGTTAPTSTISVRFPTLTFANSTLNSTSSLVASLTVTVVATTTLTEFSLATSIGTTTLVTSTIEAPANGMNVSEVLSSLSGISTVTADLSPRRR